MAKATRRDVEIAFQALDRELGCAPFQLELHSQHGMPGLHFSISWNGHDLFHGRGCRDMSALTWAAVEGIRRYKQINEEGES